MTDSATTQVTKESWLSRQASSSHGKDVDALVILWCLAEPERIGEVAFVTEGEGEWVLGRGEGSQKRSERIQFFRQRPGKLTPTGPLRGSGISRDQLRIRTGEGNLEVERVGRCSLMAASGATTDRVIVRPGDTIMLRHQLLLLYVRRPFRLEAHQTFPKGALPSFGYADRYGIVGESPVLGQLRENIGFVARRTSHVLIQGGSGAGKELVAGAIHGLSARSKRPMVARNAATFPATLIDAELFGNVKDYPNPGMPERQGVIGEAHQSTLFLDEIGELPHELQAHLLRVLDSDGSYQRLGEGKSRRADLRVVAATNRPKDRLKPDFLARLTLHVDVPGLNSRREDIPLLMRHILSALAREDQDLASRFFEDRGTEPTVRIDPHLVDHLARHRYTSHVRELQSLLLQAIGESRESYIALTDSIRSKIDLSAQTETTRESVTPEQIQECLDRHGGNQVRAAKELGLKNRHVLYRLIKKHGLRIRKPEDL